MEYLGGEDFREEEIEHNRSSKPWYRGWSGGSYLGSNQAIEALKKVASALSEEYDLKIVIKDGEEGVAHTDTKTKTITIGTKGIYTKGSDFYVGILLHEIAHIRHSPLEASPKITNFKNPIIAASMYNMLEDRRIEERMKDEYSGAHLYFDIMNGETLTTVAARMGSNLYTIPSTIAQFLEEKIKEAIVSKDLPQKGTPQENAQEVAAYREELKEQLLYKTVGLAILTHEKRTTFDSSTECKESDLMANAVADLIETAENPELEHSDIERLTMQTLNILDPLIPTKKHSEDKQKKQGEGGQGEGQDGQSPAHSHRGNPGQDMLDKMIGYSLQPGKFGGTRTNREDIFLKSDARIISAADGLKRKLIAVMRENERSRYVGGKRKGLLNKKALSRVARDNFRIYRKRFEPKGVKYAMAIVIDCSGSMFHGGYPDRGAIVQATEVAALMARVCRGLGFPFGITIHANKAKSVLNPRDRYIPEQVNKRIVDSGGDYYEGGTIMKNGIDNAMTYLNQVGVGRQKLMVIISDGGVGTDDLNECKAILKKNIKRGDFSPMIFYLGTHQTVLGDKKYEAYIKDPRTDLMVEAVRLMKNIVPPLQEID